MAVTLLPLRVKLQADIPEDWEDQLQKANILVGARCGAREYDAIGPEIFKKFSFLEISKLDPSTIPQRMIHTSMHPLPDSATQLIFKNKNSAD